MNIQRWMNKRIEKNERGEEIGGRVIGQMNFQRWMKKRIEKNERGDDRGEGEQVKEARVVLGGRELFHHKKSLQTTQMIIIRQLSTIPAKRTHATILILMPLLIITSLFI